MVLKESGKMGEELSKMWQRAFHDTIPYMDFYFQEVYGKNEVLLEKEDDVLRGMLHLNPYHLGIKGEEIHAHYIVGVCTEKEYRRQGVMRNLLYKAFQVLREKGEAFTYLMPADEAYYLPFSFRFGMEQYEQEIEPGRMPEGERGYTFHRSSEILHEDGIEEYVKIENEWKSGRYGLATLISEDYLIRLEKEVKSEFGCLFYVKKEGRPIGRFVLYAEDDFLSISQLLCYEEQEREEFLQQMIRFCDDRYHFRQYRITYPEDWKEALFYSGQFESLRVFQTRKKSVIMFRIINMEALGAWLTSENPISCTLRIKDSDLKEQDGVYRFESTKEKRDDGYGMKIKKLPELSMEEETIIDGTMDIAFFTEMVFGDRKYNEEELPDGFSEKGKDFLKNIHSIQPIDIPEIV